MATRLELINRAIDLGYTPEVISRALSQRGIKPLNVNETQRIRQGLPLGGNILKDIFINNPLESLKNFSTGMNTLGAMASRLVTDGDFRIQAKKGIKQWAKERGPLGVAEDIYNTTIGQPFNLTTEDFKSGDIKNPIDIAERVVVGAVNNPLDGIALSAPLIKTGVSYNYIPKIGNTLEAINAPKTIRQFFPSDNIAKVNEGINTARGLVNTKAQNMAQQFKDVIQQGKGNIKQAIRNVETGEWKGDVDTLVTTKKLINITDDYQNMLLKLGANPEAQRRVAISQSIMERLNPDRSNPNIYVDNINRALNGDTSALKQLGISQSELNNLYTETDKLFSKGTLRPLSHRYSYVRPDRTTPSGSQDLGLLAERKFGWATPEQLETTLPQAYEDIARLIANTQSGKMALSDVALKVGRRIGPNDITNIAKDEVVISPKYFDDLVREDFASGKLNTTGRRLEDLLKNDPIDTTKYGDDLFAIKKDYLEPIVNSANYSRLRGMWGSADSLWKFNALLSPQYITGNRIGNWSLNAIEGVTPSDYADVLKLTTRSGNDLYRGGLYDFIPKRLKADTSYQGILGAEFAGQRVPEAFRRALADTKNAVTNKDGWKVISGINRTIGSPVIALEAGMEFTDRAANFVRQAKRLSQETGEDVRRILAKADMDASLYNQLNNRVIISLGDYTGRNWAINPEMYKWLSFANPFFKYPTQMARVVGNQLINRPLSMEAYALAPSKIGKELYDKQTQYYSLGEDELGGLFYGGYTGAGKFSPMMLQQYHANPLTAGTELVYNIFRNPNDISISPLLTLGNTFRFMDNYGNTASSPNYINVSNMTYKLDENGNPTGEVMDRPTFGDIASNIGSTVSNMYFAPISTYNRWIGPLAAQILGKEWYPRYSTTPLGQIGNASLGNIVRGKSDRRGRKGEEIFTGSVLGNRYLQVYPRYDTANNRNLRNILKKQNRLLMSK